MGWPEYMVSDAGQVRRNGKPATVWVNARGKLVVNLSRKGKRGRECTAGVIDRLVGAAFCHDFRPDLRPLHRNGDKADSHATNLRWVSVSELEGLYPVRKSAFSAETMEGVRNLSLSAHEVAEKYNISRSYVYELRQKIKHR